jgi:C-terminal processing protease CtpA/Prc
MSDFYNEEYNKQNQNNQNNYQYGNFNANAQYYSTPPRNDRSVKTVRTVLIICIILVSFFLGMLANSFVKTKASILDTLLQEVEKNSIYYEKEQWDAIVEEMIVNGGTAMLQTIDNYGFLLSPAQMYEVLYPTQQTQPTFGISFLDTSIGYYIRHISYGSGAYLSNLMVGDVVVLISRTGYNTVDLRNATSAAVSEILNGDINTSVVFTVIRGLDTVMMDSNSLSVLDVSVTKIGYEDNFVDYYFGQNKTDITDTSVLNKLQLGTLDGTDIGYIKLNSFDKIGAQVGGQYEITTSSYEQFKSAMTMFKTEYSGSGKLILDLSGNPGGDIEQAQQIASFLIYDFSQPNRTKYLVTTLKGQNDVVGGIYETQSVFSQYFDENAAETKAQIVVLTDKNSASASELLLGCMLDYGTCTHVGGTTYGKGIAQTCYPLNYTGKFMHTDSQGRTELLSFNYGIYYTVAKYYTPNGNNIHGMGYTPTSQNIVDTTDRAALLLRAKTVLAA